MYFSLLRREKRTIRSFSLFFQTRIRNQQQLGSIYRSCLLQNQYSKSKYQLHLLHFHHLTTGGKKNIYVYQKQPGKVTAYALYSEYLGTSCCEYSSFCGIFGVFSQIVNHQLRSHAISSALLSNQNKKKVP